MARVHSSDSPICRQLVQSHRAIPAGQPASSTVVSGAQSTYTQQNAGAVAEMNKLPPVTCSILGDGLTYGQKLVMNVLLTAASVVLPHYDDVCDVSSTQLPTGLA